MISVLRGKGRVRDEWGISGWEDDDPLRCVCVCVCVCVWHGWAPQPRGQHCLECQRSRRGEGAGLGPRASCGVGGGGHVVTIPRGGEGGPSRFSAAAGGGGGGLCKGEGGGRGLCKGGGGGG